MSDFSRKDTQREAKARIRQKILSVRDAIADNDRRTFDRLIREICLYNTVSVNGIF